jgi:hypothetical protein
MTQVPAILVPKRQRKQKRTVALTQSEIQMMRYLVRTYINTAQDVENQTKTVCGILWQHCDKSNPSTEAAFHMFSDHKKVQKKAHVSKLKAQEIQRKLRVMERG